MASPKPCELDPIQTYIFLSYVDELLHVSTPVQALMKTVVRPTLKKQRFDKALFKKYHIASIFFFNSKILSKVLNFRLEDQSQLTNLHDRQKSAYPADFLLRVHHDICISEALDNDSYVVL